MSTKSLKVFGLVAVMIFAFTGSGVWGDEINRDHDWQLLQQRLQKAGISQPTPIPQVREGLKAGGDLIWWFQGIENVVCVSEFTDVDGDSLPDVLMESYDSGAPATDHFFCIKGNSPGYGTVLWSCRPTGGASSGGGYGDECVSYINDVNGDGHADALLGTAWGGRCAYAINGMTGATIWTYDTYAHADTGWVYSICAIPDVTGDGIDDVIFGVGSPGDAAMCVNGTNGNLIWKFHANDAIGTVCAIEDVNNDGYADAVIGGMDNEYRIICLSGHSTGTPSIIWQFTTGGGLWDVSVIEDVDGDGYQDVIAGGTANIVYCRNGRTGGQIWSYNVGTGDWVMRVVPIADIDDDGIQDVLVGSWKNAIICLSGADGSMICNYTVGTLNGGDVWSVDPIGDVNGDGYPEALGGSFDYYVYCVDVKACSLLWQYYTGNRLYTVRGLPDVTGDHTPDALAGTQMLTDGGRAYCISGGDEMFAAPYVLSVNPGQNESNAATNTNIRVRFDKDINSSTVNESTFVVNGYSTGLHTGTYSYDSLTMTATFNPDDDFEAGEMVGVMLTRGIKSTQGGVLNTSYAWFFTVASASGSGKFSHAINYGAGNGAWSVYSADLDGDSDLDLVVANLLANNVSVLINNGDGIFASAVNYPVGTLPRSVFCADLDGDGDLDLAVANYTNDNVSILKNNGDGTFQSAVNYPVGDGPYAIFCANLDRDGDLDLAVANAGSDNVSILKNNGNGTFAGAVNYGVGNEPHALFCADLDGDFDLDLAVANSASDSVSILKNKGDATFQNKVDYPVGDSPASVFCADLDGDLDLDLVVANYLSNNVSVLKNNGDGSFQSKVNYATGRGPLSVFCSDLDGESHLDFAVVNYFDNNISVFKNNGNGTFSSSGTYSVGTYPSSVTSADFDGDGDMDLAVANKSSNNVSLLFNCTIVGDCTGDAVIDVGDVVFLVNYLFKGGAAPNPLKIGDVTCDGVVDVGDVVFLINYLFKGGPVPCC
jgi:hypothetical protein